jgi:hypothetical protein
MPPPEKLKPKAGMGSGKRGSSGKLDARDAKRAKVESAVVIEKDAGASSAGSSSSSSSDSGSSSSGAFDSAESQCA